MSVDRNILIIGKNGQVGWELCRVCTSLGSVVAVDYPELDLAQPDLIRAKVREVNPSIIINAAAYTAVDEAESESELAMAINGVAPGILAEEAKRMGSVLVHYSTDYVYDGKKGSPYVETDVANPLNVYGRTKLAGDEAITAIDCLHLIFRTGWVYGWRGRNFLLTMLSLAKERERLRVVNDQYGTPTWSRLIAEATAQVLSREKNSLADFIRPLSGVYHLTCSGHTTWFGFARAIFDADPEKSSQQLKVLEPISTSEYPTAAVRPRYSVLDGTLLMKTFALKLPDWTKPLELWRHSEIQ